MFNIECDTSIFIFMGDQLIYTLVFSLKNRLISIDVPLKLQ